MIHNMCHEICSRTVYHISHHDVIIMTHHDVIEDLRFGNFALK